MHQPRTGNLSARVDRDPSMQMGPLGLRRSVSRQSLNAQLQQQQNQNGSRGNSFLNTPTNNSMSRGQSYTQAGQGQGGHARSVSTTNRNLSLTRPGGHGLPVSNKA